MCTSCGWGVAVDSGGIAYSLVDSLRACSKGSFKGSVVCKYRSCLN